MQLYTWFYSLSEALSPEKEAALKADFTQFLSQWKSHGVPVEGMIEIRYGQFVVNQYLCSCRLRLLRRVAHESRRGPDPPERRLRLERYKDCSKT